MIKLPHRLREFSKIAFALRKGTAAKRPEPKIEDCSNDLRPHIGRTFRRKLKGG